MATDLTLSIKVNDQGTVVVEKFQRTVDQASQSVTKMGNALQTISWDAITNLIQKAASSIERLFAAAEKGAAVGQIEKTFYALANAAGASGEAMLNSLTKASQGTISAMDLMSGAIQGLRAHLSPDMIEKLTAASLVFAAAAGGTVTQAWQGLMEALMTGRVRSLGPLEGNVKSINAQLENYAQALGKKSAMELDAQQIGEVLAQVSLKVAAGLKGANVALDENFLAIARAKANWSNFVDFLSKAALGAFLGLQSAFFTIRAVVITVVAEILDSVATLLESISNFPGMGFLRKVSEDVKKLSESELARAKEAYKQAEDLNKAGASIMSKPTDIPGKGILPPVLPGKSSEVQVTKDVLAQMKATESEKQSVMKALYDQELADLKLAADREKLIRETQVSNMNMLFHTEQISEGDFLNKRLQAEMTGIDKEGAELEKELQLAKTSFAERIKSEQNAIDASVRVAQIGIKNEADRTAKVALIKAEGAKIIGQLGTEQVKTEDEITKKEEALLKLANDNLNKYYIEKYGLTKQGIERNNELLQANITQQSKLSQIAVSAGTMRPEQAAITDLENQKKMLDAKFALIPPTNEYYDILKKILETEKSTLDAEIKRQQTLLSGSGGAGMLEGLRKYQQSLGTAFSQMSDMTQNICKDVENSFGNMWNGIFDKSKSFAQKMQNIFQKLGEQILTELWKGLVIKPLFGGGGGLFGGLFGGSSGGAGGGAGGLGGGGGGGALQGAWNQLFGGNSANLGTSMYNVPAAPNSDFLFASPEEYAAIGAAGGAIFKGGFLPFRAFAGGGVATRPTFGLIGEGRNDEAVVPLTGGGKIPVEGSGGNTTVNHNYFGVTDAEGYRRMAMQNKDLFEGISVGAQYQGKRQNTMMNRRP